MLGGRHPGPPPAAKDDYFIPAASADVHARELYDPARQAISAEDLIPAGFWVRFVAVLIDGIILAVVYYFLRKPLVSLTEHMVRVPPSLEVLDDMGAPTFARILLTVAALRSLPAWVYYVFFVGWRGQTPGKMLLRLKIVRNDNGGDVGFVKALVRFFAAALLVELLFILVLAGVLSTPAATSEHGSKLVAAIFILGLAVVLIIAQMVGYVMAAFTEHKRALHDYIAGSRVIRL